MEYIIKNYFRLGALGEPNENHTQPVEGQHLKNECINTFNNSDYVATITLKGSHKYRLYCNDFKNQFLLFIKIKDLISEYCQYYCINYEVHKCNEWIHSHFIFRPRKRSKMPKMRQEIYHLIEGHMLQKKSYKHRILIEKPYNYINYIEYMFKDYDEMVFYKLQSHYKLKSNPVYICPVKETVFLKTEITNASKEDSEKSEEQINFTTTKSLEHSKSLQDVQIARH